MASTEQAVTAPLRPRAPEARPPGRDQVQHDRGRPAAPPRVYGPWGASARVSYPYGRLVGDGLGDLLSAPTCSTPAATSAKGSRVSGTRRPASRPMCWRLSSVSQSSSTWWRSTCSNVILRPAYMRRSSKRSASSSVPRSPPAVARWHSARRCSRPTLPSAASAASRCAWSTARSGSMPHTSAARPWGAGRGAEWSGALRALHHRLFDHGAITGARTCGFGSRGP